MAAYAYMRERVLMWELVQKTSRCVLRRQFVSSALYHESACTSQPLFPFQSIPPERRVYEYLTSKKIYFLDPENYTHTSGVNFDSRSKASCKSISEQKKYPSLKVLALLVRLG